VDQNLPRSLVPLLESAGHDVVHTEDAKLAKASDPQIMTWCCTEQRVLITADKKLTKYFVSLDTTCPSVVVTRDLRVISADQVGAFLIANLPQVGATIVDRGNAVFTISPGRPIRAELLPLGQTPKG
jgi:predicted nuclease of predicted toxin-antitoxin system